MLKLNGLDNLFRCSHHNSSKFDVLGHWQNVEIEILQHLNPFKTMKPLPWWTISQSSQPPRSRFAPTSHSVVSTQVMIFMWFKTGMVLDQCIAHKCKNGIMTVTFFLCNLPNCYEYQNLLLTHLPNWTGLMSPK